MARDAVAKKLNGGGHGHPKHPARSTNTMLYRAICLKDQEDGFEGKLFQIRHFQSVTDAYKWLQPAREDQERERWHLRLLWSVVEEFKIYEMDIQEIGYNEPQNPEEMQLTRLFIQKVEYMDSPLPIL